jgi:hypothetical protein
MIKAIMQATVIYIVTINVFESSVIEVNGQSNDHWEISVTIFTCLFMIVNNKIMLTTKYFHPLYIFSVVFTIAFYYLYLIATNSMKDVVE